LRAIIAKTKTHKTIITLPPYSVFKRTIDGNQIEQLGNVQQRLDCEISVYSKTCLLAKSSIDKELFITIPKSKDDLPEDTPVLQLVTPIREITEIGKDTPFKWIRHPKVNHDLTPADIVQLWQDCFTFREENFEKEQDGLRRPQLGAVHAIAGHLTVNTDPATIVMPTGTGKTETMLSALVYCQCPKVLVIVPSDALRTQLFNKFLKLGCLPQIGVLPESIVRPRVALIKSGIKKLSDVEDLLVNVNVIVTIPDSLSSFSEAAFNKIVLSCTHLFIDEAHHVPAPTWKKIKSAFKGKPVLQFTATPFRRDGQSLDGTVIYNYPLGSAQKDGYFRHIQLAEIEEYDDSLADEAIANKSLGILREDIRNGFDHLLMARVSSKERARQVLEIYEKLCPDLHPVMVYSGLGKTKVREAFSSLSSRQSLVIVCVDMLGEGFDLPNLKVAALHDHHKSLAVTLQFVGRFTRVLKTVGDASVVVNISDPKVHQELQALYAENADWDDILRRKSEATIEKEIALQKLIDSFKQNGNLASQLSLWNLRPAYSVLIYETNCEDWTPKEYASCIFDKYTHWHSISASQNILVALVARQEEVKWGKYRGDIKDSTFELLVAYWNKEKKALFLHCSDYNFFNCQSIAGALTGKNVSPVVGEEVFRIFGNIERPIVRNLGVSKTGAISFTMYFGSNITEGLDEIEQKTSQLSNITVWGYEDGDIISRGCSKRKGKIWSITGGTISDWCEWCDKTWDKITDTSLAGPEIFNKFLRPVRMKNRHNSVPLAAKWGQYIISEPEERVTITFDEQEFHLHQVDLNIDSFEESGSLLFSIETDTLKTVYELNIDEQGYSYVHKSGPQVLISKGKGQKTPFSEYMDKDAIVFEYVDGAFSYNNYLVPVIENPVFFEIDKIISMNWDGVDIKKESQRKERRQDSIQHYVLEKIKDEYDIVFDDDAKGEAADIIAICQESPNKIKLCLVHCKYSHTDTPTSQIKNMYEVCGQAQKCIRWKHNKFDYLVEHMKKREVAWAEEGFTRFVKGSLKDLIKLKPIAKKSHLELEVIIAQPGLSKAAVSTDILQVLGGTELYLKKTAKAKFSVLSSA